VMNELSEDELTKAIVESVNRCLIVLSPNYEDRSVQCVRRIADLIKSFVPEARRSSIVVRLLKLQGDQQRRLLADVRDQNFETARSILSEVKVDVRPLSIRYPEESELALRSSVRESLHIFGGERFDLFVDISPLPRVVIL